MQNIFIEFNGHIIKVIQKNGKTAAVLSNQEELADHSADLILLDQDPEILTDNIYNQTINKVFQDIKGEWERDLKKNVMRILGFSDSWSKWEVDHCNGRMSDLTTLISGEVKKLMLAEIGPEKLTLTEQERNELREAVRQDLKKNLYPQYRREFDNQVQEQIREAAKQDAKDQVDEFLKQNKKGDLTALLKYLNRHNLKNR